MVMSAPTDRLYQGITMNYCTTQSEMIALSYGGKGERPSRHKVASLPDHKDTVAQRLRNLSGNRIKHHISK